MLFQWEPHIFTNNPLYRLFIPFTIRITRGRSEFHGHIQQRASISGSLTSFYERTTYGQIRSLILEKGYDNSCLSGGTPLPN